MSVILVFPIRQSFAEDVEERYIAPRTDSVSAEQNNLTFRRPKPPRRVVSTEQDMNCSGIKGDSTVSEPCDHLCRRRSLPPNRAITEAGGSVHKHIMLFRRTDFPPNRVVAEVSDSVYKNRKFFRRPDLCHRAKQWLYKEKHRDCAVSMQRTSDGVTSSLIVP